jgi:hypothetical protein
VGFTVTLDLGRAPADHVVTVRVELTLAETNTIFLSGDTLVSWPPGEYEQMERAEGGAEPEDVCRAGSGAPRRTTMFVSELARLANGLKIGYRQAAEAERAAALVRMQLLKAGIMEETENG